jgi:plastocyanin
MIAGIASLATATRVSAQDESTEMAIVEDDSTAVATDVGDLADEDGGPIIVLAAQDQTTTPPPTAAAPVPTYKIGIVDFDYRPSRLTINVGDTVQWTNYGPARHTATEDDHRTFDSGALNTGDTYSYTFGATGTWHFHCNIHPWMTAAIRVVQSGAPSAADQAVDIRPPATSGGGYGLQAYPYMGGSSQWGLPAYGYPYYQGSGLGYPFYGGYGWWGYPYAYPYGSYGGYPYGSRYGYYGYGGMYGGYGYYGGYAPGIGYGWAGYYGNYPWGTGGYGYPWWPYGFY